MLKPSYKQGGWRAGPNTSSKQAATRRTGGARRSGPHRSSAPAVAASRSMWPALICLLIIAASRSAQAQLSRFRLIGVHKLGQQSPRTSADAAAEMNSMIAAGMDYEWINNGGWTSNYQTCAANALTAADGTAGRFHVIVAADCSGDTNTSDINAMIALAVAHPRGAMWINSPASRNGAAGLSALVFGAYRADLYGNPDKWDANVLSYWRNRGVPIFFIPTLAISATNAPRAIAVTNAYQATTDSGGHSGTLRWCDIASSGFYFGSAHTDTQNVTNNTTFQFGCNAALPGGFACVESVCGPCRVEAGPSAGNYFEHEGVQGIHYQFAGYMGSGGVVSDAPWMVQVLTWDDYHDGNAMQSDTSQNLLMSLNESPNQIRGAALPAPTATPSATAGTGGSLAINTPYYYFVAYVATYQTPYVAPSGEGAPVPTTATPASKNTGATGTSITISSPGTQNGADHWNVYASAGTGLGSFYLQNPAPIQIGAMYSYTIDSLVTTGYTVPSSFTTTIIPKYSSLPRGGFADALSFFSQWYVGGAQPPIYRDRIYYEYRGCQWNQLPNGTTLPALGLTWTIQPTGGTAPDDVYATVLLTAHDAAAHPTLTITVGGTPLGSGTMLTSQITDVAVDFGSNTGSVVLSVSGGGPTVTGPAILANMTNPDVYCGVSP